MTETDYRLLYDIASKRIEELEKENEELRNNGFTVSAMTEQQLKVAIEKGEQLEKDFRICEKNADTYYDQRTRAKEIIREYMRFEPMIGTCAFYSEEYEKTKKKAEQFLKEIEK